MSEDLKNRKKVNNDFSNIIKERAALLAESINELKDREIRVNPNEPIEGKMFWPEEL